MGSLPQKKSEGMGGGGRRLRGAAVGREPGRRRGEDDDDETVSASGRPRAGPKFGWAGLLRDLNELYA